MREIKTADNELDYTRYWQEVTSNIFRYVFHSRTSYLYIDETY